MGWARVLDDAKAALRVAPHLVRQPGDFVTAFEWVSGRDGRLVDARAPWWPRRAIAEVARRLPNGATVFEYGGGGSTLWLEDRGARVTTVEHDREWHDVLRTRVAATTTLLFRPPAPTGTLASDSAEGFFDEYVASVGEGPYDLVIVDGRCRVACVEAAYERVKPGGLLLLDDSDRPKYARAHMLLARWEAEHVRGLKRGSREVCQTSLWRRTS